MTTIKINYIMTIQLNKKTQLFGLSLYYRVLCRYFCHLVYHVSFIRSDAFSPIIICHGNKSKAKKKGN
jgi:hypothetical protein